MGGADGRPNFRRDVRRLGEVIKLTRLGRHLTGAFLRVHFGRQHHTLNLPTSVYNSRRVLFAKGPKAKGAAITGLVKRVCHSVKLLSGNRIIYVSQAALMKPCVNRARRGVLRILRGTEKGILFVSRTCTLYSSADSHGSFNGRIVRTLLPVLTRPGPSVLIVVTKCRSRVRHLVRVGRKLGNHFPRRFGFPSCATSRLVRVNSSLLRELNCILSRSTHRQLIRVIKRILSYQSHCFYGTH